MFKLTSVVYCMDTAYSDLTSEWYRAEVHFSAVSIIAGKLLVLLTQYPSITKNKSQVSFFVPLLCKVSFVLD